MGSLDAEFRALAVDMLEEFSDEEHLLERHASGYDPATATNFPSVTSASVRKSPNFPFKTEQVDGSNVLATDAQAIVAALPLETASLSPVPGDGVRLTLTVGAEVYTIRGAEPLESGDQIAAYVLHLRAG
tara:strand:- start:141 stop:530 length:390 start_codon:yes stop_codon:yes gene_type:complete